MRLERQLNRSRDESVCCVFAATCIRPYALKGVLLVLGLLLTEGCGGDEQVATPPTSDALVHQSEQPSTPAPDMREDVAAASGEASPTEEIPRSAAKVIEPEQAESVDGESESWTSFRNSPQQLGVAHTALPDELELLWEHDAPDGVPGTPAIVDGRVYVGILHGDLLCLELRTGELVWSYRSIESEDPEEFAPGFQTPVTVTDELTIAGDEDGVLHAVERDTGKLRWKHTTGGEVVGGATVVGDSLIFGSHGGRMFRLKLADGSVVWDFETRGPVNASQAIGDGFTFVTGCDQPILRVVDIETGKEEREIPIPEDGLLVATPALEEDMLYFGTSNGIVFALDWRAGQAAWQYSDPNRPFEIHSSPAITEDLVIIGSRDKRMHAINRQTGEAVWTFATRAGIDSSPVVVGERVYFGSGDKNIYGISIVDGQEVWKYPARQSVSGSPAVGEGHLVIGTEGSSGRILCFGAK